MDANQSNISASEMPEMTVKGKGTVDPMDNIDTIPEGLLNQPGQKISQQRRNEWRLDGHKLVSVNDQDEAYKPFELETFHGPYSVEEMGVIALAVLDYYNLEGVFQNVNPVTMALVKKSIELRVNAGEGFMF